MLQAVTETEPQQTLRPSVKLQDGAFISAERICASRGDIFLGVRLKMIRY